MLTSPKTQVALIIVLFTLIPSAGFGAVRFGFTLSPTLRSINFGNAPVNSSTGKSETLTNYGRSTVTISQVTVSGAFKVSGLTLPLSLASGQRVTFAVNFIPTTAGSLRGNLTVVSNRPTLTVPLSGTGTVAGGLTLSPASLSFGSLTVGTSASKSVTLTASDATIVVSSATTTDPEFTLSGVSFPLTIAAGKSVSLSVNFKPQSSGATSANISLVSNASNSPAIASVSGTGTALTQHQVNLNWSPSTSSVAGYNVYRGTITGGPYSKLNSAVNVSVSFTDNAVQSGQTYFYVTTAVASSGTESVQSNEVRAAIPTP